MNSLNYCKKQRAIRDNPAMTINEKTKLIMLMVAEDLDKVFIPKRE